MSLPNKDKDYTTTSIRDKWNRHRWNYFYISMGIMVLSTFIVAVYFRLTKGLPKPNEDTSFEFILWFTIVLSLFMLIIVRNYKFKFFCPHCYHVIFADSIKNIKCPYCSKINKYFTDMLSKCKFCKISLKFIDCPYCHKSINLHSDYFEKYIKQKIYEK